MKFSNVHIYYLQIDWANEKIAELHPLAHVPLAELYPILTVCFDKNDLVMETTEDEENKKESSSSEASDITSELTESYKGDE